MIIAELSNSVNVTERNLRAQRRADYEAGFEMYCDGLARHQCRNDDQRRGWDAGCKAQAYAETVAWCATHEVYA